MPGPCAPRPRSKCLTSALLWMILPMTIFLHSFYTAIPAIFHSLKTALAKQNDDDSDLLNKRFPKALMSTYPCIHTKSRKGGGGGAETYKYLQVRRQTEHCSVRRIGFLVFRGQERKARCTNLKIAARCASFLPSSPRPFAQTSHVQSQASITTQQSSPQSSHCSLGDQTPA